MKTMQLGNTGVEVSALCLGTMYFGTRNDQATAYTMLNQYTEAGGTFLDTANIYARWIPGGQGGESEILLGEWMRERGNRDQLLIASKVGFEYGDVPRGLQAHQIEAECNKSLKRLGIETIDLYYAHKDDPNTPLEETLAAFDKLVQAGKVRFIGASNYMAWRMEEARWVSQVNGWAGYCCVQQRHSYLRPKLGADMGNHVVANEELYDWARRFNVTILAFSAMLGGAYTRSDRPLAEQYVGPDSERRLAVLKGVATEVGATPSQIVLAWMLHSDPPVLPLIAASSTEVMQDNLGALNVKLSANQMRRLNEAGA
jgi:aryl-alcohol dehydrogenase-like predicted oxidoreductase